MKNKREIVESKYPPRNNEDIWLKDLLLYASTTKGWLPLGSEKTYSSKEELLADKPAGGTIGIDKETGTAYLYNDVTKEWTPIGGGGGITETTWQELKNKRDASKLTPGALYRITDYQCTTTQKNTRSAGHQFDIVLLALSENKLAEEGWAMMHENVYDVTFADGVTKKCWIYILDETQDNKTCNLVFSETRLGAGDLAYGYDESGDYVVVDEENKTAETDISSLEMNESDLPYNYFQNSNLSAWKVWYCLDNDTSRFAWADGGSVQPATITVNNVIYADTGKDTSIPPIGTFREWKSENNETVVTNVQDNVTVGTTVYSYINPHNTVGTVEVYVASTLIINGRGVIYRMIDEWNNDVPYDFKNIQFVRQMTDGRYDPEGEDTWVYTFTLVNKNDDIVDASLLYYEEDLELGEVYAMANYINPCVNSGYYYFPFNVFISDAVIYHNKLDGYSTNNTCVDINSTVMYGTSDNDNLEAGFIYIGGKKVLTES